MSHIGPMRAASPDVPSSPTFLTYWLLAPELFRLIDPEVRVELTIKELAELAWRLQRREDSRLIQDYEVRLSSDLPEAVTHVHRREFCFFSPNQGNRLGQLGQMPV